MSIFGGGGGSTTDITINVRGGPEAERTLKAVAHAEDQVGDAGRKADGGLKLIEAGLGGISKGASKTSEILGKVTFGAQSLAIFFGGGLAGALGAALGAFEALGNMVGLADARIEHIIRTGGVLTEELVKQKTGIGDLTSGLDAYARTLGLVNSQLLTFRERQDALAAIGTGAAPRTRDSVAAAATQAQERLQALRIDIARISQQERNSPTFSGPQQIRDMKAEVAELERDLKGLELSDLALLGRDPITRGLKAARDLAADTLDTAQRRANEVLGNLGAATVAAEAERKRIAANQFGPDMPAEGIAAFWARQGDAGGKASAEAARRARMEATKPGDHFNPITEQQFLADKARETSFLTAGDRPLNQVESFGVPNAGDQTLNLVEDEAAVAMKLLEEQARAVGEQFEATKGTIVGMFESTARGAAQAAAASLLFGGNWKKAGAEALRSMAVQAGGEALMETAFGLKSLAFGNLPSAALHFKSAAVFAGIAVGGAALAGGRGGGGGGGGSGGAASGGGTNGRDLANFGRSQDGGDQPVNINVTIGAGGLYDKLVQVETSRRGQRSTPRLGQAA